MLTSILNDIFWKIQYNNGMPDLHLMALTLRLIFTNYRWKCFCFIDSWWKQGMNQEKSKPGRTNNNLEYNVFSITFITIPVKYFVSQRLKTIFYLH